MRRTVEVLIFDWDGTLFDSVGWIVENLQEAAQEVGLPVPSRAAARGVVGLSLAGALETLFPGVRAEQTQRLVDVYRRLYDREPVLALSLFEGVLMTLEALKSQGYQLAIATGKPRRGLDRALDASGGAHLFATTRCADETASKPDPLMVREILAELGAPPERALLIGDSLHDLRMAQRAGIQSIAVTTGAHDREELMTLAPLFCIDDLRLLSGIL